MEVDPVAKQKTVFVWILLVLIAIWGAFQLLGFIGTLILGPTVESIPGMIASAITLAAGIIYFIKLYNVSPDVIRWTHITFGLALAIFLVELIVSFVVFGPVVLLVSALGTPFILLIYILPWIGISMHLRRAKRDNLMDFS